MILSQVMLLKLYVTSMFDGKLSLLLTSGGDLINIVVFASVFVCSIIVSGNTSGPA
jgi:hypothetical protein